MLAMHMARSNWIFLSEKWFYAGALFEQGTFQDLHLCTSFFVDPGYQFLDEEDYVNPYANKLKVHGEIGRGFFNEDFKLTADVNYFTGRGALNIHWPVLPWLTLFHQPQGFPSLENTSAWYVTSQQGIRTTVWENLITTFQIYWRYNAPAPDTRKTDTQYILSLGYAVES